MSISASDVSNLRSLTGAGMMDCKNALEEAGGDADKAADILRKKGVIKAAKRAGKIASEGTVNVAVDGDAAVVVEINAETDFVAKNDDFKQVVAKLTDHLLANKPVTVEQALTQAIAGETGTVQDYLINLTAKIGEKISLRRFAVLTKTASDVFGAYIHLGGKIGVVVVLQGSSDQALAKDVAMHAAASAPKYLAREAVPAEAIAKEKEIYTAQLKGEGKPENIITNILNGKLNKFYSEVCLVDQMYIKDDKKPVSQILPAGVKIKEFVRFELGEGIEKPASDFAAEVQEQLG